MPANMFATKVFEFFIHELKFFKSFGDKKSLIEVKSCKRGIINC
jgi:hypothetical protein